MSTYWTAEGGNTRHASTSTGPKYYACARPGRLRGGGGAVQSNLHQNSPLRISLVHPNTFDWTRTGWDQMGYRADACVGFLALTAAANQTCVRNKKTAVMNRVQ